MCRRVPRVVRVRRAAGRAVLRAARGAPAQDEGQRAHSHAAHSGKRALSCSNLWTPSLTNARRGVEGAKTFALGRRLASKKLMIKVKLGLCNLHDR